MNELILQRGHPSTVEELGERRWNPFKVPNSRASSDSRIAALSRRSDNLETWSFGHDDSPQGGFWYSDGQGWRNAYRLPGPIGSPTSGIAAVSRNDTTMEAWWIGIDGSVQGAKWYDTPEGDAQWHLYENPVAGPLRASTSSGIAAVSREPKRMEIWWIGIDGSVQGSHWWEDDSDPKKPWRPYPVAPFVPGQPLPASTTSGIAAVSRFTDNMEIWWVGPRGSVEGAFWYNDGKPWRRYEKPVAPENSAAQAHCIAAVSRTEKSMDVVWVTPKGQVQHAYWNDGDEWTLNPQFAAGIGSASSASGIALVAPSADSLEAFWVSPTDDSVQGARWVKGTGWQPLAEPIAGRNSVSTSSGIAATVRKHDNKTDLAVTWIGPDRMVQGVTTGDQTSAPDWVVHGIVRKDGGPHPDHLTVRAYNKNVSGNGLGTATTGADGTYRIAYKKPNTVSRSSRRQSNDFAIVVAAFDFDHEGKKVAESRPKSNPDPIEEINLDVVSDKWVIRGVVEDQTGQPISGVTVVVADRDLGLNAATLPVDEMGRAVSGSDGTVGGFRITYRPRQEGEATRDGRWSPDLTFRLHTGDVQVPADVFRYIDGVRSVDPLSAEELLLGIEAGPDEQVALRLTAPSPGPDGVEFDVLSAAIAPLLPEGQFWQAGMLNEERHRDITFAAREIGWDVDLVTLFVAAHRMAANNFKDVPADILYGLARCDLHLHTVAALALATKQQLIDGIKQAIQNTIIRPRGDDAINRAADSIRKTAPEIVLDGGDGASAYKNVLDIALGSDDQARRLQQLFLTHAAGNEDNPKAMWDALRSDANFRNKVERTQFVLQLDALTGRHTKLMQAIVQRGVTSARQLLTLTAADFKKAIVDSGEEVPQDLPGASEDKAGYWAAGLVANVHQAFPTLSVAGSVKNAPALPDIEIKAEDPAKGKRVVNGDTIRPALAKVLERAADIVDDTTGRPAAVAREAAATPVMLFDIGRSRLDDFVKKHSNKLFEDIPDDPPGFHQQIKGELNRTQRLYRVSTSPAAMDWLLTKQYHSAFEIALLPEQAFVAAATAQTRKGAPTVPEAEAIMMHSRARAVANSVMATHLHLSDARYAAGIRALNTIPPNPALQPKAALLRAEKAEGVGGVDKTIAKHLPNWVKMFGTTNYCACKECQSIYSPAAYLVTLLDFLDRAHPNADGVKPLDVMLTLRPDLETLKLTCENTNTQIPYVDLVNRVLETLAISLDPQDIPAYDIAGATAPELAAAPQNTDWYAYITAPDATTKRADRAAYPHSLPFDAALDASRGYLTHLGVRRAALLKTFAAQAQPHALTAEYLQLAAAAFELITEKTLDDEAAAWVDLVERYGFDVEPPDPLEEGTVEHPVTGRVVWALKQKLIAAGAALSPDADPAKATYDAAVTTAVMNYQTTHGLSATGKTDAATWHALTAGEPHLPHLLLPHVPTFLHRTSLTYTELVDILKTRFINPLRDIYDIVVRLKLPAKPLLDWIKDQLQGQVPTPLLKPLDDAKITPAEFRAWAVDVFGEDGGVEVRRTIVVDNPNPAACDLESSVIRYWDSAQQDVSDTDWMRLDKLIRLWRATGWTVDDLDLALTALQPDEYEDPDADVVAGIGRIAELSTALDLSVPHVVLLFSDLDPARPTSLYHKVFRNKAAKHIDPAFDPDWTGTVLRDATIGKQLPALQSGLRIGDADMAALRKALGLTKDTEKLTVSHVSDLLRYVTLARALGLNVRDLLTLLPIITNTPTLPTGRPTGQKWPLREFITDVQNLGLTDLNVAQLNNIISTVASLPPDPARDQLLKDLATKLKALDEDLNPSTPLGDDLNAKAAPREALARRVLGMLQQPDALVDAVMLILTGRDQTTTTIDGNLAPAPKIPDEWHNRLQYQPKTGGALVTCIGALTDGETEDIKKFSGDPLWTEAVEALREAPRKVLTKLRTDLTKVGVTVPMPAALLATALRDDPKYPEYRDADIAERLQKLLDTTVPVVRDQARRALINQALLVVVPDATTLNMLLTGSRGSTNVPVLPATNPTKTLIDDLLGLGNEVITEQAHQAVELLKRTQQLVDGFALTGADLNVLVNKVISLRANTTRLLTYNDDVREISAYARCRRLLGSSAEQLPDVIKAADEDKARALLAELLAVPADMISAVVLALKGVSLQDPLSLERVLAAVNVVVALGVSVSAATSWVRKPATPPTVDEVRTRVDAIRRAVKARYDDTAWLEVAKALHDPQRDARRAALVDYLVARLAWLSTRNPDGLYQRLFVQVEMSSCMKTSPIRFAIDSVHTFIHRCLLGLEKPAVNPDQIDQDRWNQVLHSQQLYRADLEVLINPENYMLPELRDDKSPAFAELEGALLSEDLTDEAAERAITAYLEKADAVAKLDVVALHVQRGFEPREKLQAIVHVLGRTANAPYKHFYRRLVVADAGAEGWTPWEEVPLDVRGDLITMVTFERRLYLFWAQLAVKTRSRGRRLGKVNVATGEPVAAAKSTPKAYPSQPQENSYEVEVQLCWSEYRNGAWAPKNVTDESQALTHSYAPPSDVDLSEPKGVLARLETKIDGDRLEVLCIADRRIFPDGARIRVFGSFILDGCHGKLRRDPSPPVARLVLSYRNAIYSGAVLLVENGVLKIKALNYAREITPSSILKNAITNLHVSEEHWIHHGADYFAFSDAERGYFASLQKFGNGITASLVMPDINYPITRALVDGFRLADVAPTLAQNKKDADIAMRPWAGYSAGVALFGKNIGTVRSPAAAAVAEEIQPRALVQLTDHAINIARATAVDVGIKFLYAQFTTAKVLAETFYDPFVCTYLKRLRQHGIPGLLTLENQQLNNEKLERKPFQSKYDPNTPSIVQQPFPTDKVDFGFTTPGVYRANAYAVTNRELFIEIPMLLAKRFRDNRRFEDALRYLKYVWDFTNSAGDYWRAEPLRLTPTESVEKWLTRLKDGDPALLNQIHEWQKHPFQPHFVARMRPSAYQRYVVMETLDTLLEWGDAEFRRDTTESITKAAQLYVLVADLLGPRPEEIATGEKDPKSYKDMRGEIQEGLAIVSADFENLFPSMSSSTVSSNPDTVGLLGISRSLYFCIPPNEKLLAYWDTVADRLFKIRHCMNIEGVVRQLPLFEPRIDPALLVRAAAQGIHTSAVIAEAGAPLPPYRFEVALRRALDACGVVTRLGSQLLGIIERGDAEKLAALNATHATAALKATLDIKKQQEEAATAQIAALQTSRDVPAQRLMYYQFLMGVDPKVPQPGESIEMVSYAPKPQSAEGTWLIQEEIDELASSHSARDWQVRASTTRVLAGALYYVPNLTIDIKPWGVGTGVSIGGSTQLGPALNAIAEYQGGLANQDSYVASHAARMAAHKRRSQEFAIGANTAAREIMNIDKQITVAMINKEVARLEREQIELQIQQAEAVEAYLDSKFTNAKMYGLLQSRLYGVYAQFYKLAYDLAKQAERCYRFRYPELTDSIIQAGNWESGRKGLLSGEQLELQLRQLERAYADRDSREFELTKHISLLQHAPLALIKLRETGSAEFDLPELLFDMDYPGHYMRRIKSVNLTIPAVVGPYTTVNATLTLLSNEIRIKPTLKNQKYERDLDNPDDRFIDDFAAIKQIATSSGQNDHGLFELNFRDERFLPFEGAGVANSRWRIDIDPDCNPFDIPDVVMCVRLTARQGGDVLRAKAKDAWIKVLKDQEGLPLARVISMRHEFPTEWDRLRTVAEPGGEHTVAIALTRDRFPALFRRSDLSVGALDVFGVPAAESAPTDLPDLRTPSQSPGEHVALTEGAPVGELLHFVARLDDQRVAVHADPAKAKWWLTASSAGQKESLKTFDDVLLVCHYSAKSKSQP
ncbi:neuraminidase-like domain-containing protein [Mycolicibacterium senegalense]|uniref:Tc toxin subunit A-related protein n=1 Tax=Mycolicibacterium senegalense TaxID=1796 RepID=UPI003AABF5E0